ncbi:MAG: NADH-quinone oxidoreductase subunit J [candidate division NC10 bacterium]|nr:NADH-quinone oxidoreductase subunit J [candidate division NC10 bacterium]
MTLKLGIFYFLAAFTVWAAAVVVLGKNIVRSAVALIFGFCGMAALYVLLDAEFLAAVQVLIYVGGITILLLFAIMLTSRIGSTTARVVNDQVILSAIAAIGLLVGLIYASTSGIPAMSGPPRLPETAPFLGRALLTTYALPFEAVSVLLLAAMVGAIVLARED